VALHDACRRALADAGHLIAGRLKMSATVIAAYRRPARRPAQELASMRNAVARLLERAERLAIGLDGRAEAELRAA
jgi:hypothetical protein